jgi:UDP-glucose 4-epimerase
MSPSTVLVTGASRFIGGQLTADPTIARVLAVDAVPPSQELSRRMGRVESSLSACAIR